MGRNPIHLGHRFFEVLFARPLDDLELAEAAAHLGPDLWPVFATQQIPDQRHGYQAGAKLAAEHEAHDLVVAAMLHDVGKAHSGLGVIGRTVATLLMTLHLPMTRRMERYRDHGELGARDLESLGAPRIVVAFARHHQGDRPELISPESWAKLIWADQPGMPRDTADR